MATMAFEKRVCYCRYQTWAGLVRKDGVIVGETPKTFYVRLCDRRGDEVRLGLAHRIAKRHVKFDDALDEQFEAAILAAAD